MKRLNWVLLAFFVAVFLLRAEEAPPSRVEFLKMIDRPKVDPAAEVGEAREEDEFKVIPFSFFSEKDEKVFGLGVHLISPPNPKLPAVIVMHGTGGKKESQVPLMKKLAKDGILAVAIDGRFHGERAKGRPGTDAYNDEILKRFKGETKSYPLYWDTVWDLMRLVDIMSGRDDVDGDRIGAIGFSKGGIECYFLAAADPRVAVAVPCIGVQSFKWGLENDAWQGRVNTVKVAFNAAAKEAGVEKPDAAFARTFFDKVLPGVYGKFDGPEVLPTIMPRPLLVINGDTDPHTPLPGVNLCAEKTRAAYEKAGAAEKFKLIVEPQTGHKVNPDAEKEAVEWFVKWMKL